MKLKQSKEWFEKAIDREDSEVTAMTPEHVHHVGLAWSKLVTRQLDLQAELATLAKDDMQTATRIEQEIQSLEQRIRRAERLMGGER